MTEPTNDDILTLFVTQAEGLLLLDALASLTASCYWANPKRSDSDAEDPTLGNAVMSLYQKLGPQVILTELDDDYDDEDNAD